MNSEAVNVGVAATAAAEASEEAKVAKGEKVDGGDLRIKKIQVFEGIFRAWPRQVSDKTDSSRKVTRFKCICQTPKADNPDVRVDVTAWISAEQAERRGIYPGANFVGRFAHEGFVKVADRGEFNEERGLSNAVLLD